jgi:hypothetical protein
MLFRAADKRGRPGSSNARIPPFPIPVLWAIRGCLSFPASLLYWPGQPLCIMQKSLWGLVFAVSACGAGGFDVHIRFAVMHFMHSCASSRGEQPRRRLSFTPGRSVLVRIANYQVANERMGGQGRLAM